MHLIKVGRRRLNLNYLVMDEEDDGSEATRHLPPGGARLTMECGATFDLNATDAEVYRRQVVLVLAPDPGPVPLGPPSTVTDVDTESGVILHPAMRVPEEGS